MAVGFEFQTGAKIWSVPPSVEDKLRDCKTYAARCAAIMKATNN